MILLSFWPVLEPVWSPYDIKNALLLLNEEKKDHPPILTQFANTSTGFMYWGIKVTQAIESTVAINYDPLLREVGESLKGWSSTPISMVGHISIIKGKLLYPFSGLSFWFWTPINTIDQTIKSVDIQKTVTCALSLPCISCILSKRSVSVNYSSPFPSCAPSHSAVLTTPLLTQSTHS